MLYVISLLVCLIYVCQSNNSLSTPPCEGEMPSGAASGVSPETSEGDPERVRRGEGAAD